MIGRRVISFAASVITLAAATPLSARSIVSGNVEVASEERRRGLSWSDGAAVLSAEARLRPGLIEAGARVVTLRQTPRFGGADGVVDLDLGTGWYIGPVYTRVRGIAHVFTGADERVDYGEVAGDFSYSLGPAQVNAGANWAPRQSAIGGNNLYLFASGNVGIPATALTVTAAVGRSSGTVDDARRAARLRPGGNYTDWQIGVEHVTGPLTLGLDYVGTDVREREVRYVTGNGSHSGNALIGRARWAF